MEYTPENVHYVKQLEERANAEARKYRKVWSWFTVATSGKWIVCTHKWVRYDWGYSPKPSYGIPYISWSVAEVLSDEEMTLKKLQDETVELDNEDL